jgi:hypothetical protein
MRLAGVQSLKSPVNNGNISALNKIRPAKWQKMVGFCCQFRRFIRIVTLIAIRTTAKP